MIIHVRFAGYFRTLSDKPTMLIELDDGATVDDARAKLDNQLDGRFHNLLYPQSVESTYPNCLFVIETQIAELDTELHEGDVLAIVPPMAGGDQ